MQPPVNSDPLGELSSLAQPSLASSLSRQRAMAMNSSKSPHLFSDAKLVHRTTLATQDAAAQRCPRAIACAMALPPHACQPISPIAEQLLHRLAPAGSTEILVSIVTY
jgi:hypothetical protein